MADKKAFTYKNVSDQEQALIGVGLVPAGKTVETDVEVRNANFEEVSKRVKKKSK